MAEESSGKAREVVLSELRGVEEVGELRRSRCPWTGVKFYSGWRALGAGGTATPGTSLPLRPG
jgi:hypothetical protein